MSKLKKGDAAADHGWQCDRLIYGEDGEFEVYAVREEKDGHRPWRMRLMVPTSGVSKSGVVQPMAWTTERLIDALQGVLRRVRSCYGGSWYLEPRARTTMDDDRVVPATVQQRAELRRKLDAIMRPKRPPIPTMHPPETFAGLVREEPGATEPEEASCLPSVDNPMPGNIKPLPQGHVKVTGELPEADEVWFEAESVALKTKGE